MRLQSKTIVVQVVSALLLLPGCSVFYGPAGDRTGINELDQTLLEEVDQRMLETANNYDYLSVALVRQGRIILTKS